MKKFILTIIIILFSFSSVFAFGKREADVRSADDKEGWQESFPIHDKKSGKYNIMVTAEDQGGNKSVAGPYNIYIDPDSDLPITGITNPPPDMRVPGNLNIVGTCVDDDAVDHVELILDGDDENFVIADGKEFWSYYLDTTQLEEGIHKIKVTGVDIHGVRGYSADVVWHLDRHAPSATVTNHELGDLVSNRLELTGEVSDGNGIKSLVYSLDNSEAYEMIDIKRGKNDEICHFKFSIDTKKLSDGPHVCWFRATDKLGSEGISSYLFFVDNTKPTVELVYPTPEDKVNGIFSVAGSASDVIGITSLKWQFDNQSGDFELIPGNPYWTKEFDIRGQSAKSHNLVITAVDKVGNVTVMKRKIDADPDADLPKVFVTSPAFDGDVKNPALIEKELFLRGYASDDDGIAEIHWQLDNNEEKIIESNAVFCKDILEELGSELLAGSHSVKVWAVDIHGIKGPAVTIPFTAKGAEPKFETAVVKVKKTLGEAKKVRSEEDTRPVPLAAGDFEYIPGMEINPESQASITIPVTSGCGLNRISWFINGEPDSETLLKGVKGTSKIELSTAKMPWGAIDIAVEAEDVYGRITKSKYQIYATNLSKVRGKAEVVFSDSTVEADGRISFADTERISGYLTTGNIVKADLIPDEGFAEVTVEGNSIVLQATGKTGTSRPAKIRVTTDKNLVYESRELYFDVKIPAPLLEFEETKLFDGFEEVTVAGRISEEQTKGIKAGWRILTAKNSAVSGASALFKLIPDEVPDFFLSDPVLLEDGTYGEPEEIPNPLAWQSLPVSKNGSFKLILPPESFEEGISIIEFYGESEGSERTVKAVAVKKVSPLPEPDPENPKAKAPVAAPPAFTWLKGEQLYYTCYYQGELTLSSVTADGAVLYQEEPPAPPKPAPAPIAEVPVEYDEDGNPLPVEEVPEEPVEPEPEEEPAPKIPEGFYAEAVILSPEFFRPGSSAAEIKIINDKKKAFASKVTVQKQADFAVYIDSVNGEPYASGIKVVMPGPNDVVPKDRVDSVRVLIETVQPITSVTYSVADSAPVKATVKKAANEEGAFIDNTYEFLIPLKNLEAEITSIKADVEVGKGQIKTINGTICVVREEPATGLADEEQVYWLNNLGADENGILFINGEESLLGYINVPSPYTADFSRYQDGLIIEKEGNSIGVKAQKEGLFRDVTLLVKDSEGVSYTTQPVSFLSDFTNPDFEIVYPAEQAWIRSDFELQITATDANGISGAEYSLDEGESWLPMTASSAKKDFSSAGKTFVAHVMIESCNEGLMPVDIRVTDNSGKTTVKHMSLFKDVTPPEVTTIVPPAGSIVNGSNIFVLRIKDNGKVLSGDYILPASGKEPEKRTELGTTEFITFLAGSEECPLLDEMSFMFVDAAGNVNRYSEKGYVIDNELDKPVVEIHLPEEDAIVTTDFTVSGIVYDDDGESRVWYKIDNGSLVCIEDWGSSWAVPIELKSLSDNEHTITVYAEDLLGVKSEVVTRSFRVSLEEPKGEVQSPTFEETVTGVVTLRGTTSDKNGIDKVQVSVDNGNTWHDVSGEEFWSYEFDTRVIQDGTHVIFLRVWDNYGVQGLYSNLINIDNTPPEINLGLPLDGSYHKTGVIFLSGQTTDNIGLEKLTMKIRNMDLKQPAVPSDLTNLSLKVDEIINQGIDVHHLADGFYNLEVSGEDAAGNITRISRNIYIDTKKAAAEINLMYPMNGEHVQGVFNIYGSVISEYEIKSVTLLIDGQEYDTVHVSPTSYYKFEIDPSKMSDGEHVYSVRATLITGKVIYSREQYLDYKPNGPWVKIDSLSMGDFAVARPYLEGLAGYAFTEAELVAMTDKNTSKYDLQQLKAKAIQSVEISFDNGKTFSQIGTRAKWRYRIENDELAAGCHYIVVRATMRNGETAVTRTIVQVDKTAPSIKLISPGEGGHYNEAIIFAGLTSDDVKLKSISMALRSGDKASYEVPSFIQGLYFDAHVWGATLFDVGMGFTFFDDNVKLQAQFGQMTQAQFDMMRRTMGMEVRDLRYGGNVFGAKLLANLGTVPFSYYFGPDFSWLSANFAVGANFSLFSETQSKKSQVLSAVVAQIEFPRVTLTGLKMFRTFSFYTEAQMWFIPTDVEAMGVEIDSLVPQIAGGIRINLF